MHECRQTLQRERGIGGAVNPPVYFVVTCGLVLHFHSANCLFIESPRRRHELPARYGLTLASLSFSHVFSFSLTRLERGLNHPRGRDPDRRTSQIGSSPPNLNGAVLALGCQKDVKRSALYFLEKRIRGARNVSVFYEDI